MKTFLFIFLVGYAVKCDDSYYVVQMPDRVQSKDFKVYWNVPTMQCKSKKIPFNNLFEQYGIIQNTNDTHRGDKISILYDPGFFPALVKNESTGEIVYRNGGVPQQGDLMEHLQILKHEMEDSIPNKNFNGVGILDFEAWRPVLRQNFGSLTLYKNISYDIERERHKRWKEQRIQEEATRRFESASRDFMQTALALAKKMRPKAIWGYYDFPHCYNRASNSNPENCAKVVPEENDGTSWLWSESTVLYPSVYSDKNVLPDKLTAFIRGRIEEAERVRIEGAPILPYWWYRYRNGGFFTETDLDVAFSTFYNSTATGFIIWGSSSDVNTIDKCNKLRAYVTDVLGPAIAKYTKPEIRQEDIPVEISNTTSVPETVSKLDSDDHWVEPNNFANEELKKDNSTFDKKDIKNMNESTIVDLVLHKIVDYCSENCRGKVKPGLEVSTKAPAVVTTKNSVKEASDKHSATESTSTSNTTTLAPRINNDVNSKQNLTIVVHISSNDTNLSSNDTKANKERVGDTDKLKDRAMNATAAPVSTDQVSATFSRAASSPAPVASVLVYLVIYVRSIVDVSC